VSGVALVSPGAAIQGFDVYEPFARIRTLPSFLAGAKGDNVSREPITALASMARGAAAVKEYPGGGHSFVGLAETGAPLAEDLGQWLETLFDEPPPSVDEEGPAPMDESRR
jgi:hypothetical protein